MKIHELKTWPSFFDAICRGTKTFELRKNDRDFATGDQVILEEWDPEHGNSLGGKYTGRKITRTVGFIVHGGIFGIEPGYCAISLLP